MTVKNSRLAARCLDPCNGYEYPCFCIYGDSSVTPKLLITYESTYQVAYSYTGCRLTSVTEYGAENGDFFMGAQSTYEYSAASGKTTVQTVEPKNPAEGESADNVLKTVYTFDDDGNVLSEYVYSQDTGNTGAEGEESGIHPHSGEGGAGIVSNINNLLTGHNFENLNNWASVPSNCDGFTASNYTGESYTKFGGKSCRMCYSGQADGLKAFIRIPTRCRPAAIPSRLMCKFPARSAATTAPACFFV